MLLKRKSTPASSLGERRSIGSGGIGVGGTSASKVLVVKKRSSLGSSSGGLKHGFRRPMIKRRAYGTGAQVALKSASLGCKKRYNGMNNLLARAGKGLTFAANHKIIRETTVDDSEDDDDEEAKKEIPFDPLCVWKSPHSQKNDDNATAVEGEGLEPTIQTIVRPDEYGIEEEVTVLRPAPATSYSKKDVYIPPLLAKFLRPHQREGVQFLYECVMGLKPSFTGNGCILADDMGLGKTLQSVNLIYTMLKTGITANGKPSAKRVIVICPCSLVKNWDNEFVKWLGPNSAVKTVALAEADRKKVEREIDGFCRTTVSNVLIASYECIRMHIKRFLKYKDCCDLLVCDEAHRLKNSENQTSMALNSLPVKRRVLLTGTPMQNDLSEFFAMVDFTNPGVLGTPEEFRRHTLHPILRGREPDASDKERQKMLDLQNEMSVLVKDFILRRINTINAKHLPPKLVQVVCCRLTDIQQQMYQHLVDSKATKHIMDGKQVNCLGSIQALMKLSNHPSLIVTEDKSNKNKMSAGNKRSSSSKQISYNEYDAKETAAVPGADGIARFLPYIGGGGGRGGFGPVHPEWSGKMNVLHRLMKEMRKPGNGSDKIVIISNYTQTLDLIGRMCQENNWRSCRLDGSITMKKRQKMVDDFNDPGSSLVAFLLSSKAGGCGINLIGGNRLVLFDPDWNPAVDKQAAARCWRDGQKKRCFTYRFLATGTVEEKIFQRQLSKEGLQSVVDDKEQVNALSTKDLKNLFKLRHGTPSDTHDKLRCERCKIVQDNVEIESKKVLPQKLKACLGLLEELHGNPDSEHFRTAIQDFSVHGKTKEEFERLVKQPMNIAAIRKKLCLLEGSSSAYESVSDFSKDVNRIFTNVAKVCDEDTPIGSAAKRLQLVWLDKWSLLVPVLMTMKSADESPKKKSEFDDKSDVADVLAECGVCSTDTNERRDDYQEQIGMPDEEDMRSWSHHHTTDTVDDPIFRAAMRGSDSVSFCFGLEVTWSLIQQRQQDEEEKLAMKALETIDEAKGDDDDDDEGPSDDEDTVQCKDSKVADRPKKKSKASSGPSSDCENSSDDEDNSEMNDFLVEDNTISDEGNSSDEAKNSDESDNDDVPDGQHDDSDAEQGDSLCEQPEQVEKLVSEKKGVLEDLDDSEGEVEGVLEDLGGSEDEVEGFLEDLGDSEDEVDGVLEDLGDSEDEVEGVVEDLGDSEDEEDDDKQLVGNLLESTPNPKLGHKSKVPNTAETESTISTDSSTPSRQMADPIASLEYSDVAAKPDAEDKVPDNVWSCAHCTFHNKKSLRKCKMCGVKKPTASKNRRN